MARTVQQAPDKILDMESNQDLDPNSGRRRMIRNQMRIMRRKTRGQR
jgi:hypothetical protein